MARTAWAQLKFELDGVYHSLRSNTLKERKSAREQLLVLTDDAGHRHFLARGGPRGASLWPRVIRHAKLSVDLDVAAAKKRKKAPSNDLSAFLLRIVRRAEEGGRLVLSDVLEDLVRHAHEHLSDDTVRPEFAPHYLPMLIKLFEVPRYCNMMRLSQFEEVARCLMEQLVETTSPGSTDRVLCTEWARAFNALVCNYGGDIHINLLAIVGFVENWCCSLDMAESHSMPWPIGHVLQALTAVLQKYGTSCAGHLQRHHKLCSFVQQIYTKKGALKLSERPLLIEYLRVHLRIASICASDWLSEESVVPILKSLPSLQRLFFSAEEIADATKAYRGAAGGSAPGGFLELSHHGRLHLALCCDIIFLSFRHSGARRGRSQAKNQRTENPWDEVKRGALSLRDSGGVPHHLPYLQVLWSAMATSEKDGPLAKSGELRLVLSGLNDMLQASLDEVSHAWVLACLVNAAAMSSKKPPEVAEELQECWTSIWRALLRSDLPFMSFTSRCQCGAIGEVVMTALHAILKFRLITKEVAMSSQDALWRLPAFRTPVHDMSPSVLSVIPAFLLVAPLRDGPDLIGSGIWAGAALMDDANQNVRSNRLLDLQLRWLSEVGAKSDLSIDALGTLALGLAATICPPDLSALAQNQYCSGPRHPYALIWRAVTFSDEGCALVDDVLASEGCLNFAKELQRVLSKPVGGAHNDGSPFSDRQPVQGLVRAIHAHASDSASCLTCAEAGRTRLHVALRLLQVLFLASDLCPALWKSTKYLSDRVALVCQEAFDCANYFIASEIIKALAFVAPAAPYHVVKELLAFCTRSVEKWSAGQDLPTLSLNRTPSDGVNDGVQAATDDFMDVGGGISRDPHPLEMRSVLSSFAFECTRTSLVLAKVVPIDLARNLTNNLMEAFSQDCIDEDDLVSAADHIVCASSLSKSTMLDSVICLLRGALSIESQNPRCRSFMLLQTVTVLGRAVCGDAEEDCTCGEEVRTKYGELATFLTGDVLTRQEVRDEQSSSWMMRDRLLWASLRLFRTVPSSIIRDAFMQIVMTSSTQDKDAMVRWRSASCIEAIFARYRPAKHQGIYEDIIRRLPPVDPALLSLAGDFESFCKTDVTSKATRQRPEQEREMYLLTRRECEITTLETLVAVASVSPTALQYVLFHLCSCGLRVDLIGLVLSLLDRLAERLVAKGYCSGSSLMLSHVEYIAYRWLTTWPASMHKFPMRLLGFESARECFASCGHVLVPLMVLCQSEHDLEFAVQCSGGNVQGIPQLVKRHFADVMAFLMPLEHTDGEGLTSDRSLYAQANSFILGLLPTSSKYFTLDLSKTKWQRRLVLRLLDVACIAPFGPFVRVSASAICRTFHDVVGKCKGVSNIASLFSDINFAEILLHLRYHLERASDKNRVIGVILAVLGEMNWNIYSQYITITAHTLTSLVLSYGTHQTWGTNAIDLIRYFHQSCSGPHSRIFLLSRHIAPICRALVAVYTELDESPEEKEGVEALKQQICQLLETILVHSDLQELVKSIDVPGVGQVSRDLFAWKDSQGASYSAVDRLRCAVLQLKDASQFKRKQLLLPAIKRVQNLLTITSDTPVRQITDITRDLISVAVKLCQLHIPQDVQIASLKLVGHIGGLAPDSDALHDMDQSTKIKALHRNPLEPLMHHKWKAMSLLCSYLSDWEKDATLKALTCVRCLSGLPEFEIFAKDSALEDVLAPFAAAQDVCKKDMEEPGLVFVRQVHKSAPNAQKALSRKVWSTRGKSYEEWVCQLTQLLLLLCASGDSTDSNELRGSDDFLFHCAALSGIKPEFAECLFPAVVYELVRAGAEYDPNIAADCLAELFEEHLLGNKCCSTKATHLALASLNALRELQVSAFLVSEGISSKLPRRRDRSPLLGWEGTSEAGGLPFGFHLPIPYDKVVAAAMRSGSFCSALLYAESMCERQGVQSISSSVELQHLFSDIFAGLADADNVRGVSHGSARISTQLSARIHECDWQQALPTMDAIMSNMRPAVSQNAEGAIQTGIATALMRLGLPFVLQTYLAGLRATSAGSASSLVLATDDLADFDAELQWRGHGLHTLGAWAADSDLEQAITSFGSQMVATGSHFNAQIEKALLATAGKSSMQLAAALAEARSGILSGIDSLSLESGRQLSAYLVELQELVEIEEAFDGVIKGPGVPILKTITQGWSKRTGSPDVIENYDMLESVLALREVLLRILCQIPQTRSFLFEQLHTLAEVARETNHLPEAASAIMRAWTLCKGDSHELWALNEQVCSFAEARLAWSRGETDSAIQLAKSAANVVSMQLVETSGEKHASAKELLVDILCTTGEWTSKTRSESSQDILDDFLRRAVQDAAHLSQARKCAAHFQLASYVAGLHMRVRDRVQSAEWKLGRRVVESRQNELMQCEKAAREIRGDQRQKQMFQRHAVTLRREVSLDIEERQAVEMTVQTFLLEALSQYEEGLKASTGPDLHHVFQVASLWFANQEDTAVLKAAERIVRSVPSYKFVPLAYQISSRISLANHSAVTSLIQRLCREHPHHILPKLIALANGEKVSASSRGSAAYKQNLTQSQDRIRAAKRLLQELQQTENAVGALVTSLQQLSDGYIAIASADTRSFQDKKMKEIQIMSISRDGAALLEKCGERAAIVRGGAGQPAPMITRPPPIDPSCNYGDVLSVISFAPTLRLADSGIHCPMILHCKGSDGITYQQLVKGEDDLRQDAIMQQTFHTVNSFLAQSAPARRRKLGIRTYTITPLSPVCGVLEWVENTIPFGSYLCETRNSVGAHKKYYPRDWLHRECRKRLKDAATSTEKLRVYHDIEKHFHPCFRFFFLEKYVDPYEWHIRRQQYTRSVATSSIVGYVLGIGDRHTHNILVDLQTAEVVHIDFGVTFEQGKALSTPETVPFRLTRDVVDGMGSVGTEGNFRASCEASLQVLRDNTSSLITVLEVFIHDPLFKWMLSPVDARLRQLGEETENGVAIAGVQEEQTVSSGRADVDAAERALLRVRQKLQGYEDPNGQVMGIAGQVNLLINEAQSAENLCKLFPGWAPWL